MANWQSRTDTELPIDAAAEAPAPDDAIAGLVELATGDDGAVDRDAVAAGVLFVDDDGDPADPATYLLPVAAAVDGAVAVIPALVESARGALAELVAAVENGDALPDGFAAEAVNAADAALSAIEQAVADAAEGDDEPAEESDDAAQRMRDKQRGFARAAAHIRRVGEYDVRAITNLDIRLVRAGEATDDEPEGTITGHAATFWVGDDWGTAFAPKAFRKTLKEKRDILPLLWMHDPASVVGPVTSTEEDDAGLAFAGRIIADDGRIGTYVYRQAVGGTAMGMSFGFRTVQDRSGKESDPIDMTKWPAIYEGMTKKDVRVITEVELYEYSILPATFASNPASTIDGVRSRVVTEIHRAWAGERAPRHRAARRGATQPTRRNVGAELLLAELGVELD